MVAVRPAGAPDSPALDVADDQVQAWEAVGYVADQPAKKAPAKKAAKKSSK